jgi:hypothetical protein
MQEHQVYLISRPDLVCCFSLQVPQRDAAHLYMGSGSWAQEEDRPGAEE